MNLRSVLSVIILILFSFPSAAQLNLYTGYQGILDDNIYNNNYAVSDFINVFSLGTAYNSETELNNVQLFYDGSFNLFRTTTSKSFNIHRVGIVETHLFSENLNPLNAGVNYSFRNNKDDFTIYDFSQLSAYVNYRHALSESSFIIPGYLLNFNTFKNFTIFSNTEHRFFLVWNVNFESKTSLNMRAEGSYKQYSEQYNYPGYQNDALLARLRLNVGQSLSEQTGLNIYGSLQKDLSEGSRYILSDSLLFYEEEIFNDVYSYTGLEAGLGLKHLFSENIQGSVEAKYLRKMYTSLPAVDINGVEQNYLREDDMIALGAGIELGLNGILEGLSLSVFYNYYNNASNDYFYKYTNNITSVSLDYGF